MKKALLVCLSVILLHSCAMQEKVRTQDTRKTYNLSYNNTFKATMSVLHSLGYMIEDASEEHGTIDARRHLSGKALSAYDFKSHIASFMIEPLDENRTRVSLLIYVNYQESSKTKEGNKNPFPFMPEYRDTRIPRGFYKEENFKYYNELFMPLNREIADRQ